MAPQGFNTHHRLKLLALVAMTVDHVGSFLYPDLLWLRAVGHLMVPAWFFLIGQTPPRPDITPILKWAIVLAVLNPWLGEGFFPLNNLVTIFLSLLLLQRVEARQWLARYPLTLIIASLVFFVPSFLLSEYGSIGFLYMLMGYALRTQQMDWWRGKLVAVIAAAAYVWMVGVAFAFTPAQLLVVALGTILLTWHMAKFHFRPVVAPVWFARPALYFSRHSIQYYVGHRLVLQSWGILRGTLKPGFHWI